jgi:dipeptidase D
MTGRPENLPRELLTRGPEILWDTFAELSTIPRESKHEQAVMEWLKELGRDNGWEVREDRTGNVVLAVPGKGRGVDAEAVAIQSHSDMVCVKETGVEHNFRQDPIDLQVIQHDTDGEILTARGTTLGADNGIGLSAALAAALSDDVTDHPPLEIFITVDEETGLTGALELDPSILTAPRLLNLDTEESNCIYISCAGSRDMEASWEINRTPAPDGYIPIQIDLNGMAGGHSGAEIHEERGNSVKSMLEIVERCLEEGGKLSLLSGGTRRNVIPSTAEAVVWIPADHLRTLTEELSGSALTSQIDGTSSDYASGEVTVSVLPTGSAPDPLDTTSSDTVLAMIANIPHGPQRWSDAVPGLVETSNNLAMVEMNEEGCAITCMTRSSKPGAVEEIQATIELLVHASDGSARYEGESPAWEAEPDAELLARAQTSFRQATGVDQEIRAIHAGLECGAFRMHKPDMEMISFGPDIREAHTVNEYIILDSVEPFWKSLKGLLDNLCDIKA